MNVVHLSKYRRLGGLRRDQLWVERAFPERCWVIAEVLVAEDGQRRVVIEPLEDRSSEAIYAESYFRRHFMDRHQWLRRQNERVLSRARRQDSAVLLDQMAQINAGRTRRC